MTRVPHYHVFETAMGFCAIGWRETVVSRFQLPTKNADSADRLFRKRNPESTATAPPAEIARVIAAAKAYFDGKTTDFSAVPLDLGDIDPFFAAVYDAVRRVGWGQTTTYGAVAKNLGAGPEYARDVGLAMATNPVPLVIPCHRVLAAGGKVGGFSAPGGAASKVRMLEL